MILRTEDTAFPDNRRKEQVQEEEEPTSLGSGVKRN
jgi:hypothetical protein